MNRTDKRVCLLTGASGKLGTAFCRHYARKYHIAAVYRKNFPKVVSQRQWVVNPLNPGALIPENAHPVFAIQADLNDDYQIGRVVELVLARFDRVDVLVNAAVHYSFISMLDTERLFESLEPQFNLNVMAPIKLATTLARYFWRDRYKENCATNRNVINVSSISGLYVVPDCDQSVYSASKAALNYLTLHMANEFRPIGIRVNAAAPTSFPQAVSTESVADSIVRLDDGNMTGKILVLDQDGERFI